VRLISILSFAVALGSSFVAQAQDRGRDPGAIVHACDAAFNYDFQRTECVQKAHDAGSVTLCAKGFNYDFQRMDCIEKSREASQTEGCLKFGYDFQRFDCLAQAQAIRGGVGACLDAFSYDFQRFDCLKLRVTGNDVRYCATKSYDYEKFDCLKQSERTGRPSRPTR
jgi:hypothetical protein